MKWTLLAVVLVLTGCGVDGPPEPVGERQSGLAVSGTAKVGVSGSF